MAIKLIFFDVEGTLVLNKKIERKGNLHGTSVWARIFEVLGSKAMKEDDEFMRKFDEKAITYIEWCEASTRLFQKYGLTKKVFDELIEENDYREGTKEVIEALHKKGIRTALISGGFIEQARRVQQEFKVNHAYAAVELFWDKKSTIAHFNVLPSDYKAKVDFVELLCKECGITKEECAFVGNGDNDKHIAKHVGTSFAVDDAHGNLKSITTHTLNDFRDILKYA